MNTYPNNAPRWEVQPGDRFLPYSTQAWMSEQDYGFHHYVLEQATTLPRAIKRGLDAQGSDDFNIAAIRGGRMVAALWMEEVVDDDPIVIDEIAAALGLDRVSPHGES